MILCRFFNLPQRQLEVCSQFQNEVHNPFLDYIPWSLRCLSLLKLFNLLIFFKNDAFDDVNKADCIFVSVLVQVKVAVICGKIQK